MAMLRRAGSEVSLELQRLLEATFFEAHIVQRRQISMEHLEAAALELAAPQDLVKIRWPEFSGQIQKGHYVEVKRGETTRRGRVIDTSFPMTVMLADGTPVRAKPDELVSSGMEESIFMLKFSPEKQAHAVQEALQARHPDKHAAVALIRERVEHDSLPLLSLLEADPLLMQSSHLSFQEFFAAQAISKGMSLPADAMPWQWGPWWKNTLRFGKDMGKLFGVGLHQAAGSHSVLDLHGRLGPEKGVATEAVAALLRSGAIQELDLSDNGLNAEQAQAVMMEILRCDRQPSKLKLDGSVLPVQCLSVVEPVDSLNLSAKQLGVLSAAAVAACIRHNKHLKEINLSKNSFGNEGIELLAQALNESPLTSLDLYRNGVGDRGAEAFAKALAEGSLVTSISLARNLICDRGARAFERVLLQASKSLTNLNLEGNPGISAQVKAQMIRANQDEAAIPLELAI